MGQYVLSWDEGMCTKYEGEGHSCQLQKISSYFLKDHTCNTGIIKVIIIWLEWNVGGSEIMYKTNLSITHEGPKSSSPDKL